LLQKQRTYIATYRSKHRQASARWRKKNPEFYRDYYRRHRRELLEYGVGIVRPEAAAYRRSEGSVVVICGLVRHHPERVVRIRWSEDRAASFF
jgi:hypothetical protein